MPIRPSYQTALTHYCEYLSSIPKDILAGDIKGANEVLKSKLTTLALAITLLNPKESASLELKDDAICREYAKALETFSKEALLDSVNKASRFVIGFFETILSQMENPLFQLPPSVQVTLPPLTTRLFHLTACGEVFTEEQVLGDGKFGKVSLTSLKDLQLACKTGSVQEDVDQNFHAFVCVKREACVYSCVNHPNILSLLGYCDDPKSGPQLYLEHAEETSLNKFLEKQTLRRDFFSTVGFYVIDPTLRHSLFLGISRGVSHLHRFELIHRDLAARNILIMRSATGLTPKICDFGVTSNLEFSDNILDPFYAAPESLDPTKITQAIDVFAVGVIAYQLFRDTFPYIQPGIPKPADPHYRTWLYNNKIGSYPIPQDAFWVREDPHGLRVPMAKCLHASESLRPTMQNIVEELEALPLAALRLS